MYLQCKRNIKLYVMNEIYILQSLQTVLFHSVKLCAIIILGWGKVWPSAMVCVCVTAQCWAGLGCLMSSAESVVTAGDWLQLQPDTMTQTETHKTRNNETDLFSIIGTTSTAGNSRDKDFTFPVNSKLQLILLPSLKLIPNFCTGRKGSK